MVCLTGKKHQRDYGICRAPTHQAGAGLIYEAMVRTKLHKVKQLHTIKVKLPVSQQLYL